jgi:hypothetical protein
MLLLCSALSTTAAAAAPMDARSSHLALRALHRYITGVLADAPAWRQADDAFVASTAANCPNVLAAVGLLPASSATRAADTAMGEEIGVDLAVVSNVPDRAPVAALTRTISSLRWSRVGKATRIRRSLEAQRTYFSLPPSDLCTDARAFAAANAQTTPPGTLQFLATFGRLKGAAGLDALYNTIQRFVTPADNRLVDANNRLLDRATAAARALEAAELPKLSSTLGLPP